MRQRRLQIDINKCMGCCACEIACKMEYDLPRGVRFIVMKQSEESTANGDKLRFGFDVCRQCKDPICKDVCPQKSITKREDGIVIVDEKTCTGCRLCLVACPWKIPQFQETDHGGIIMRKCSLCNNRLDQGLQPSCVIACPAEAIKVV